jgi:hypothetical protein
MSAARLQSGAGESAESGTTGCKRGGERSKIEPTSDQWEWIFGKPVAAAALMRVMRIILE